MIFNMALSEEASLAELTDIRIGENGEVYPSAGDAVRGQVGDLKEDLTNLENVINVIGTTKAITSTWSMGYIRNDGTVGSSSTTCVSGNVTFAKGGNIDLTVATGYSVYIAEYLPNGGAFVKKSSEITGTTRIQIEDSNSKRYRFQFGAVSAVTDMPENAITYQAIAITDESLSLQDKAADAKATGDAIRDLADVTGWLITKEEKSGYLNSSGGYSGTSGYHCYVTNNIPCKPGDVFLYRGTASENAVSALFRNSSNTIIGNSHLFERHIDKEITIPSDTSYVQFSSYASTGDSILLQVSKKTTLQADVHILNNAVYSAPLSGMPSYILNNLTYKPLGALSKGYICFVTDDGNTLMNTRTIPLALSKGIPFTFAIMKESDVMSSAENIAIVKDAIQNGGCSVAQHGGQYWNSWNEEQLNSFFDGQQTFFDTNEIPVKGAVIPGHRGSKLISAVAGGRYGVVRSGYDGEGQSDPIIHYNYYSSGARTNLYALSSCAIEGRTLAEHKDAIDYAIQNNKLLVIHMHEANMTETLWTLLEDVIDYALSQPITFITLGDVITII